MTEEIKTEEQPLDELKINDEAVNEEEIKNWLKEIEEPEVKDTKKENNYVTKDDFDKAIKDITSSLQKKAKSNDEYEDDEEEGVKGLTKDDIKEIINRENSQLKNEFMKVFQTNQIENTADMFEKQAQAKYPGFSIDKLHLEFDVRKGLTLEKALEKQLKQEQQRIINYKKNFEAGIYKVEIPRNPKDNIDASLPTELRDFNPELHKNRSEFQKQYPNSKKRDEYFKKLEMFLTRKK